MTDVPSAIDIGCFLEMLVREQRIKLEITGGVPTWRLLPSIRHQKVIDRIRASITPYQAHQMDVAATICRMYR